MSKATSYIQVFLHSVKPGYLMKQELLRIKKKKKKTFRCFSFIWCRLLSVALLLQTTDLDRYVDNSI